VLAVLWPTGLPLFGQDVTAALRDRLDQPLFAQDLDSSSRGVSGDAEQVNEVFLRGQGVFAGPELAGFDPGS